MAIYDICVLRCRASLGILRSETLLESGDHLREPVYFLLSKPQQTETRNGNKVLILPEHVQPIQDDIPTNVPCEDGTREPVPHLEQSLEKSVRLGRVRG
jgi:hypothetical protein